MVCLSRPYHLNFFRGCLPQILLGPFLNTLSHIEVSHTNICNEIWKWNGNICNNNTVLNMQKQQPEVVCKNTCS